MCIFLTIGLGPQRTMIGNVGITMHELETEEYKGLADSDLVSQKNFLS